MKNFVTEMLLCLAPVLWLCSCDSNVIETEKELWKYISDESNHLSVTINQGTTRVTVSFMPTDILVAREVSAKHAVTPELVKNLREKYNNYYYFTVKLSDKGEDILQPEREDFSEMLNTVSFRMRDYVKLTTSKDTVQLADFSYQRTFGLDNTADLLMVFAKPRPGEDGYLNVTLDEFGLRTGKQAFRFQIDDLERAPQIFKM